MKNKTQHFKTFFLLMLMGLMAPVAAWAQFGGGDGSQGNPYIISTTDHMTELANNVNGGNTYRYVYFRLDADLDYTGKTYTIIADYIVHNNSWFSGKFNGNGHTISGVTLDRTQNGHNSVNIGLFGTICFDALIENLTLSASTIKGRIYVGGIVGEMKDFTTSLDTRTVVRNCHVTSDVTIETVNMQVEGSSGWQLSGAVGGIVGGIQCEYDIVEDCTSAANIIASSRSTEVGGIAGRCSYGAISGCIYTGTISGGAGLVGGILGNNDEDGATLSNNYVGGNCTIGAVGVQGSTQGTDAGYDVTHIYTIGFNSAQYVSGTIATQPTMNIGGTDYYASGSTIILSSLSTFGGPGAGNIWSFRATVSYSYYEEVFRQEDGTWQFTMPMGNAMINPEITKDISLSQYPYATYVTLTPASATYTGSSHKPTVSVVRSAVDLTEGTDFITDIPAEGYTNAGDYTFHIWGIGEYGGLRTESFTVAHAVLTQLILDPTMVYYDGAVHTPTLTVKSGSKTLSLGTEYQTNLPAGGFTDLGDYTIKAWGVGNYTDTVTATFTICHPWNGMGTWNQPFLIQNTDDMDRLATLVNGGDDYSGVYFRQIGTLDYTGKTYTPVGNGATPFNGIFEGGTMKGISVSGQQYTGVFGSVGTQGTVRGVMLMGTNSFSGAGQYTGTIVGFNQGNIESCHVAEGANITVTTTGTTAGGIVGMNSGLINSCDNHAAHVTANCAGGIVGMNNSGSEVYGTNYAIVTGSTYCGGICGQNQGTIYGQHFGTIASGTTPNGAGGIVGVNESNGTVEYGLSTDLMTSLDGANKGAIVGVNSGTVTNCYYIGACAFGGINGSDVLGQAMRGWPIIADDIVNFQPDYCNGMAPGTYYNDEVANTNYYYVGAGETIPFMLGSLEFSGTEYAANGAALIPEGINDCNETYYTMVMPAQSVTITITNTLTLELLDDDSQNWPDNESRISSNDGLNCNVRLKNRTLYKDGRWNLLCLPFAVTSLTETPLEGAEVRTMATSSTYANGTLSLHFTDALTAMEAGKPYLVRWSSGDSVTDPVFSDVTISDGVSNIESGDNNIRFVGNFTNTYLVANTTAYLYIDADGQLHYPYGTDYDLYALRSHFEITLDNGVQVGTCNVNLGTPSTYSMLPAIFQTNGDWNTAANWNTSALPTAGADVLVMAEAVVPNGYVANVGTIFRDGYYGRLTVKDGGQLYHTNDGVWATVEKAISPYSTVSGVNNGWHLIGSPATESFAPSVDNGFIANEYDLYYYHEPTHYWRNHKTGINNSDPGFSIEPLKGYLYANSANDILDLTGTLRTATEMVDVPLSYTDGISLAGFNLVGNPFAHNVTAFAGSNVAPEVYRMNDLKNEVTVSSISTTDPLLPGEGFFVKATAENASITFNSRSTNAERSNITLEVSENGLIVDRFILRLDGAPLEKFTLNENSTRIYATEDGKDWAVAVLGRDAARHVSTTDVPVNFKATKNGTYTLNVNLENIALEYLHLIDNMTGADVDLLVPDSVEGPATYTFAAKTTDYATRFRLVFNASDASTGSASDAPFAYIDNGDIRLAVETFPETSLQIVDMLGRVVVSFGDVSGNVSTQGMPAGVYVLRLIDGDSIRTQKIVIP